MRKTLTKRVVDAATAKARDVIFWDDVVRGFGLRVRTTGAKVYLVRYGAGRQGQSRWVTIGHHGAPWTVETARTEAQRILGLRSGGADPARARDFVKGLPTLEAFAKTYIKDHATAKKAPRSVAEDERNLQKHILPALGLLRVDQIAHGDVSRFHAGRKAHPINANRCLALISHMMTTAERWGLRPNASNPCRHVDRYEEKARERFLSAEELGRLGAAMADAEKRGASPFALAALRLIIFTGARKSEATDLRWEHVDLERGLLRLPESKTGAKVIYLSAPAKKLLTDLPRIAGSPFVFPGMDPKRPVGYVDGAWRIVRTAAGLNGVRIHDLRHSHASVAVAAGGTLPLIGGLLGHTTASTTQRYAHLSADPLRDLSEAIGSRIETAMGGASKPAAIADHGAARARRGARR